MKETVIISQDAYETRKGVQRSMEMIRLAHPSSEGWIEVDAYFINRNGKFRAVCVFAKPD